MQHHRVCGSLAALAIIAVFAGCSSHSGSPSEPRFQRVAAAQTTCGEGVFLAALAPGLAEWEDSLETWQHNTDLLNTPPAFTDGSSTASYLTALTPVLQQWHTALNGALGSSLLDSIPNFDAAGNHQDYLASLSAILAGWESKLETQRGTNFLPTLPVFVRDTFAPVIACLSDTTITCADSLGAVVKFEPRAVDDCDPAPHVTSDPPSGTTFPLGPTLVTWTASDSSGNTATCTFTVNVEAAQPASIDAVHASPALLWPPNHKWVDVKISADLEGGCSESTSWSIVGVTSNESDNGTGDGNTSPDWLITGDHTLKLRAERSGNGGGRIYTVLVRSADSADSSTVNVTVPHDRGHGH
jgi:HYR domain-containing protein